MVMSSRPLNLWADLYSPLSGSNQYMYLCIFFPLGNYNVPTVLLESVNGDSDSRNDFMITLHRSYVTKLEFELGTPRQEKKKKKTDKNAYSLILESQDLKVTCQIKFILAYTEILNVCFKIQESPYQTSLIKLETDICFIWGS